MNKWQERRNYRKHENADGTITYTIKAGGKDVGVSAEIYKAFAMSERKMEYMERDLKRNRVLQDAKGRAVRDETGQPVVLPEREVSLDKLLDEDWDYPSADPLPDAMIIGQIEIEMLYHGLDSLDADERLLIDALFFEGLTIRECAARLQKSKSSVDRQRARILGKLKKIIAG